MAWFVCLTPAYLFAVAGIVPSSSAGTGAIESGHSAMWYDPGRSGEGWVLEMLHDDRALLYWYTYDEQGSQRWLQGVGEVERDEAGDAIEFPEIYVTRGGRFGPDFDPDQVEFEIVGEARMSFDDCNRGEFSYSAFGQSQTIEVRRLTRTMAAGCAPIHGVTGQPVREYAGQSGSWYDRSHSGEGFSMHWLSRDEALVTWYTYDTEGNQFWMIGVGHHEDGRIVFPMLQSTRGARFGADFDPDDVERLDWGSLEMKLECSTGTASYESIHPEFNEGAFDLSRLTMLEKPACPWVRPKLSDLYDITWNEIPIDEDELISASSIADDGTIAGVLRSHTQTGAPLHLILWNPGERAWQTIEGEIGGRGFISSDGSMVLSGRRLGPRRSEPIVWREETGWQPLPGMIFEESGGRPSKDFSKLVGVGSQPNDNRNFPWIWDAENGQQALPLTEQILGPGPKAVSNDGTIVVGDAHQIHLGDSGIGVIWENGGDPEYMYSDSGELLGSADLCNHDCSVVIGHGLAGIPNPRPEAWYWTRSGQFGFMGLLPGALGPVFDAEPYIPHDSTWDGNLVVGHYYVPDDDGLPRQRGFVWTQDTGIVSIPSLVEALEIGDDNWRSYVAISVSSTGNMILLSGESPWPEGTFRGDRRAVVLELNSK